MTGRLLRLTVSCAVIGAGVGLLLASRLGSDGYSTLVNGLHLRTGVAFGLVNVAVAVVTVGLAWLRGLRPGLGTLLQPLLVGIAVTAFLPVLPDPSTHVGRWLALILGFLLLCLGVAGYLAAELGVGPAEALSIAYDPPIPFVWSYSAVQVVFYAVGWWCGADLGPGTLLIAVAIGPVVTAMRRLPGLRPQHAFL